MRIRSPTGYLTNPNQKFYIPKKSRNLYSIEDHEGVTFDQSYLDMIDYPTKNEIENIEESLHRKDPEPAKRFIGQRGKLIISKVAKLIGK